MNNDFGFEIELVDFGRDILFAEYDDNEFDYIIGI